MRYHKAKPVRAGNTFSEDFQQPYPNTQPVSPQLALRMLQSGAGLNPAQRQQAFRSLAGQVGNRAVQRFVKPKPQEQAEPAPAEIEPTPYDNVAAGENFREPDILKKYVSKLTSQHVINQLHFKETDKHELIELSEEKQQRNEFNMMGLGGWHLGASASDGQATDKVAGKNGKKKINDPKSREANKYAQTGEWQFKESPAEVIAFFNQIDQVNVPGNLHMHAIAARRLEAVYAAIIRDKQEWPKTSVGQSFRGNLEHEESTASYHAHKLGFAVDFRADVNPMLTDGRKRRLLQAVGGGSPSINLQHGHRKAIRDMSHEYAQLVKQNHNQPLSKEQEDAFQHSNLVEKFFGEREFDKEYERVRGVNNKFVSSLTADMIAELKALRETYLATHKTGAYGNLLSKLKGLEKELAKLKGAKTKDEKKIDALSTEITSVNTELDQLEPKLRTTVTKLLKPWIEAVAKQKAVAQLKLEKEQKEQAAVAAQDEAERARLDQEYQQKVAEAQQQFEQAKTQNKRARLRLPKAPKIKKDTQAQKKAADTLKEKTDERDYWVWLEDTLNLKSHSYLDFIFEQGSMKKVEVKPESAAEDETPLVEEETPVITNDKGKGKHPVKAKKPEKPKKTPKVYTKIEASVKDPSVLQLATRGFFNPDQPQKDGKDKGFNKNFVKQMLMHGFAWGATWSSQDTMHFELAEEIDKLPSSVRKYTDRVD